MAAFGKAVVAAVAGRQIIGAVAKLCGGGGGGRPNLAQAGGRDGAACPALWTLPLLNQTSVFRRLIPPVEFVAEAATMEVPVR